jgi:putative acetyltransferase
MIEIRPETVRDYAAIARMHTAAFGRVDEALIVPLLRERTAFLPDLSLVAVEQGKVIGHALFNPHVARILGQNVPIVNLAPLAVDPAHQAVGIGGRLIAAGHDAAQARGFEGCFLLGHADYYPRFGYQTRAFGVSSLTVPAARPQATQAIIRRGPVMDDTDALYALWLCEEGDVDLALEPGLSLLDWVSPNPGIVAWVYEREGEVAGYTRGYTAEPSKPQVFLARDDDAALAMLTSMAAGMDDDPMTLPLHPASRSAPALGVPEPAAWVAAMACSFGPGPLAEYLAQVRRGERPPGRPQWPVAFDLELQRQTA